MFNTGGFIIAPSADPFRDPRRRTPIKRNHVRNLTTRSEHSNYRDLAFSCLDIHLSGYKG